MGLYGMMRTGVSGMNAQANKLSAVADNIANAGTNGYKRSTAEFSSLVLPSTAGSYNSGSVTTEVRHNIGAQGGLSFTSSTTDLAIDGAGFFVVQDKNGTPFLTRAGWQHHGKLQPISLRLTQQMMNATRTSSTICNPQLIGCHMVAT